MFFDSHCHLTSAALAGQLPEILKRAHEAQVTRVLNIGDTIASSREAISQCHIARDIGVEMRTTAGVHPQNALEFCVEQTTQELAELAAHSSVVAIGEIGLDYVYDDTHEQFPGASRQGQQQVFRAQLELAMQLDLPVVIHNRESDDALLSIVSEYSQKPDSNLRGVFHCFGSSLEVAKQVLDLGFYLGFTGIITFKNGDAVRAVAKQCPLDRMLIETDAPYLAPVPHRGKTNEPSFVPHMAQTVADLHQRTVEEIAAITTANARVLFNF